MNDNPYYSKVKKQQRQALLLIAFCIIMIMACTAAITVGIIRPATFSLSHYCFYTGLIILFCYIIGRRIQVLNISFWLTAWEAKDFVDKP